MSQPSVTLRNKDTGKEVHLISDEDGDLELVVDGDTIDASGVDLEGLASLITSDGTFNSSITDPSGKKITGEIVTEGDVEANTVVADKDEFVDLITQEITDDATEDSEVGFRFLIDGDELVAFKTTADGEGGHDDPVIKMGVAERMVGVTDPPTPPEGQVVRYYDSENEQVKMKFDDGSEAVIVSK